VLGWWDGMIGPGKAFDTDRYFVICMNLLGSCRGSTGPACRNPATGRPYALDFPVVTVADMVRAEQRALSVLGIDSLLAVGGGSLGGMQALEWTVAYPDQVRGCISIASTARLASQGVAWNAIARNAIMADPDWQGGAYYGTGRAPTAGIGVARMVGHVTYLSAEALGAKFARRLQRGDDYSFTLTEPDFAVESYLRHQADAFANRFDANSYLYISRALTYFDLARDRGGGRLDRALADVTAEYLLLSFSSDWLYPPRDAYELESALRANGKSVVHHEIQASYGHDSFLLEERQQAPLIATFLEKVANQ
jgi:homoserine O-acetyltransferase